MTWLEFKVLPGGRAGRQPRPRGRLRGGQGRAVRVPAAVRLVVRARPHSPDPADAARPGLGVVFGLVVGAGIAVLYHAWLRHTPVMTDTPARVHGWLTNMHLTTPAAFLGMALVPLGRCIPSWKSITGAGSCSAGCGGTCRTWSRWS